MNWKTLSSDYLIRFPYFTVRKDKCETPEGTIVDPYYVVELAPTVCALAISEEGEAIMIEQYRQPVEMTMLEIPGGFVDKDEEAEKAIARELLEETGYEFSKIEFLVESAANPALLSNFTKLYLATGGKKVREQSLDHNEEIKVSLIPLDELKQMLFEGKIVQALHITCIFYALRKMGKL